MKETGSKLAASLFALAVFWLVLVSVLVRIWREQAGA